jgi:hypothetical protein
MSVRRLFCFTVRPAHVYFPRVGRVSCSLDSRQRHALGEFDFGFLGTTMRWQSFRKEECEAGIDIGGGSGSSYGTPPVRHPPVDGGVASRHIACRISTTTLQPETMSAVASRILTVGLPSKGPFSTARRVWAKAHREASGLHLRSFVFSSSELAY